MEITHPAIEKRRVLAIPRMLATSSHRRKLSAAMTQRRILNHSQSVLCFQLNLCRGIVSHSAGETYLSEAARRRSRWGSVRGKPVLSSHFSPGLDPHVGQRTDSACFSLTFILT